MSRLSHHKQTNTHKINTAFIQHNIYIDIKNRFFFCFVLFSVLNKKRKKLLLASQLLLLSMSMSLLVFFSPPRFQKKKTFESSPRILFGLISEFFFLTSIYNDDNGDSFSKPTKKKCVFQT